MTELTVLLVGGTGSIGREVAKAAALQGHRVRVLTRDARVQVEGAEVVTGDLTDPGSLTDALQGVDAVVFTHGTHSFQEKEQRAVEYEGVRNVLQALAGRTVRIALMTSIGVTNRRLTRYGQDWKRRAERLVRASGHPYTIVRPGWFDYNAPDQHRLEFLQGDRRWAASPDDGVIARSQIADVLLASLTSAPANRKTLELVAETGPAQHDLDQLFAALLPDDALDGPQDTPNLPLEDEPADIREDLDEVRRR